MEPPPARSKTGKKRIPILTFFLTEIGTIGHLWRMWSYQTAEGQSLIAWCCLHAAMWLWLVYFFEYVSKEDRGWAVASVIVALHLSVIAIVEITWLRYCT